MLREHYSDQQSRSALRRCAVLIAGEAPAPRAQEPEYPNPLSLATRVTNFRPLATQVRLAMYDMLGSAQVTLLVDAMLSCITRMAQKWLRRGKTFHHPETA